MLLWFLAAPILRVLAVPAPQGSSSPTTGSNSTACAQVSRMITSNTSATPSVPGSLAFDCLRSVPNRPQPAQQLIQSLKAFVQWQTTLTWLKDPPQSYTLPSVDIQGGLDEISTTATAGGFISEYDFQVAIVELFTAAHDGHCAYNDAYAA